MVNGLYYWLWWVVLLRMQISGTLLLNVQTPENKSFWSCIEYEVK